MEIIYKKIEELKPYKNNPRHNEKSIDYVAKSIKEFGFKVPIIIDKNNEIIAGHTRLEASKKLGLKEVPCIIANDLTEKQVKAFRLADNKVSDFSYWDNKLLLEELEDIGKDIFTGFEESDIFNDFDNEILDEKDNKILDSNNDGIVYLITFKTQDKKLINKIKDLIEEETI